MQACFRRPIISEHQQSVATREIKGFPSAFFAHFLRILLLVKMQRERARQADRCKKQENTRRSQSFCEWYAFFFGNTALKHFQPPGRPVPPLIWRTVHQR